jgi:signal transduction histidine kinase
MRILRVVGYGFMALVLAAGWTFFYWQSSALDLQAANEALGAMRELREIDARWNDRLIGMRFAAVAAPGGTPVKPAAAGQGRAYAALEVRSNRLSRPLPGRDLWELKRAFDDKAERVARLETAASEHLRAAQAWASTSAERLAELRSRGGRDAPPAAVLAAAERLVEVVRTPSAMAALGGDAHQRLAAALREAAVPEAVKTSLGELAEGARGLLERQALAEALLDQAWLASTGPRLDSLARTLERSLDEGLAEQELYRVLLLYYSGFLIAVLGFLVWNLDASRRQIDRINRELQHANETLEARVVERTRELSDALARLKESEAMLVQSEKMSSLGQMVAGLVHEVNTPLAYVRSSLETVQRRVPETGRLAAETAQLLELLSAEGADEARLAEQFATVRGLVEQLRGQVALEEIEKLLRDGLYGIGQISDLVANLKSFSRLDRSKVAEYDLHEGIESAIRIAQHELKHRTVQREFGTIPRVSCSPSQINQVFLNLLTNAAHATADANGSITVRTGMRDPRHVAIEIADNGQGIAPEVLPKIFDPFFTTKAIGQGTGLGLSISYKIVEGHGGRLEVRSTPGAGTCFTVVLPLDSPAALAA